MRRIIGFPLRLSHGVVQPYVRKTHSYLAILLELGHKVYYISLYPITLNVKLLYLTHSLVFILEKSNATFLAWEHW